MPAFFDDFFAISGTLLLTIFLTISLKTYVCIGMNRFICVLIEIGKIAVPLENTRIRSK